MMTLLLGICTMILAMLSPLGMVLAYLGPETLMPLASAVAAAAGIILTFWKVIVSRVRKFIRAGGKRLSGAKSKQ